MKDGAVFDALSEAHASPAPSVLLFEKDGGLRKSIFLTLRQQGFEVQEAADATGVRQILEKENPDLFVIDQDSSDGDAGALIDMFRERSPAGCQAVVVTTTQRVDDDWRKEYQPDIVVYKPFDIRFLYRNILKLL